MSAEDKYHEIASNLSSDQISLISSYYENWKGQFLFPIKFRFIKIFAKNLNNGTSKWYLLHHLVNKRRITNKELPNLLNKIIEDNIIPLRVFHSVTEWIAPNEVWSNPHHHPRIIRSGILPFENDDSLDISIQTARKLQSILNKQCCYVFSGNKSIHVWYDLSPEIEDPNILAHADLREKYEATLRHEMFDKIQKQTDYKLDKRISIDTRRVVPIIGTLNAMTGRIVVKIDPDELHQITPGQLEENTLISGWK